MRASNERKRKARAEQKASETPEEKATRLEKQRLSKATARAAEKATETPEEKATRLEKQRLSKATARAVEKATETHDEKVMLRDRDNTEMQCILYDNAYRVFGDMLRIDNVYTFTNGLTKPIKPEYQQNGHEHEYTFMAGTTVAQDNDIATIPHMVYEYTTVEMIASIPVSPRHQQHQANPLTIVAVCSTVGPQQEVGPKKTVKRDITLLDDTGTISLTLWVAYAETAKPEWQGQTILVHQCVVAEYLYVKYLATTYRTTIDIDPPTPEATRLRQSLHQQGRLPSTD